MNKTGQITLFLILGFIIIAIVVLLFYYAYTGKEPTILATPSAAAVQKYVQSCVDDIAADAVLFIAAHGGYYTLPKLADFDLGIPYFFFEEKNSMPTKEEVERQLAAYIDNELFFCLKNFEAFEGSSITQGTVQTTAAIEEESVLLDVFFPVTITEGNAVITLTDFSSRVPTKLHDIYSLIVDFMAVQEQDVDALCVSCLVELGLEKNLRTELYSIENSVIEFSIIDEEILINDHALEYHFLNSYPLYSCENLPPDASETFILQCAEQKIAAYNYSVTIAPLADQEIAVGEEFLYTVSATGYYLTFEVFTTLFTIDETTGKIAFVPTEEDVGEHTIWVHVEDTFGNEDYESFIITIREK